MSTTTDRGQEGATSADLTERVTRARAGDRAAFDLLAVGAVDGLYRIARLVLRDTDVAEDAGGTRILVPVTNTPDIVRGAQPVVDSLVFGN